MADKADSPTKTMFACLAKLYKQGQLLLMDADRLMGERGWEPVQNTAPGEFSNSLNSPERWYARWAARFYMPTGAEDEETAISRLLFVSIHFASDHDTKVDEPLVSAGSLLYGTPMNVKTARQSYYLWMCKWWFYTKPHATLEGWRQGGGTRYQPNLKGTETFVVPLYDIISSEKLEKLVIDRLLTGLTEEGQP